MNELSSIEQTAPIVPTGKLPESHPEVKQRKVGVLLINLGTPDNTDYWSMRRYLKEFLSDRRVIEVPKLIWWPILNLIILSKRPQKSGEAYASIWNKELDESPLRTITRSQSDKLQEMLSATSPLIEVEWGMRYGNPSIASQMDKLIAKGCDRILAVPLYPQYSAATTGTVNDKIFEHLMSLRWQPAMRILPTYHDDPIHIDALVQSLKNGIQKLDFTPEVIVASFHGLPVRYHLNGDPYHCYCHKTARLMREKMGMNESELICTFQSRFGKEEWLQPYTDKTIEKLAEQGVKKIAVITPGFAADCVETLEEIDDEVREIFIEHGGEKFAHIPCLNDSEIGMDMLKKLVSRELQGWI